MATEGAGKCGKGNVLAIRRGKTGRWTTPAGDPASAANQSVAERLAVPPAWTDVQVCKPGSKLAWVAKDRTGKLQYHYTETWAAKQEREKLKRMQLLDDVFWTDLQRTTDKHMSGKGTPREHQLAIATRLMRACNFRVGSSDGGWDAQNPAAPKDQPHYGLMTLRAGHVQCKSNRSARVEFIGKSGQVNQCEVLSMGRKADPKLVTALRSLKASARRSKDPLFDAAACHLRDYLASIKEGVLPKDFRTYHANYTLIDELRKGPPATEQTPMQRAKALNAAARVAAEGLSNTLPTCKRSYIYSGFMDMYVKRPEEFQAVLASVPAKAPTLTVLHAFLARALERSKRSSTP